MATTDFLFLFPIMVIAGAPVMMMLIIVLVRNLKVIYTSSLVMLGVALLSLFTIVPQTTHQIGSLLIIDRYGIMFLGIIFFTSMLVTVLSYEYLCKHYGEREEYFIILFVAVLGASILVIANHFVTFFLGLETLSISLYVLIAYLRSRDQCIEAGVKFLVIASLATAFLLFGMGLIYAGTGTMSFLDMAQSMAKGKPLSVLLLAGYGLIFTGVGFKLALVPFHMWAPDVYQGAPAPVTAFIATISKGAVLALALRLFANHQGHHPDTIRIVISGISILSMFTGNLLALGQTSVKRLLAYSSIAHLGYLLITLLAGTNEGIEAAIFYILVYSLNTIGAFGAISVLSEQIRDADNITDFEGLFWHNPLIAILLTLSFLSLAGIPLTAGFMSKFYLVLAGVRSGLWLLAFSLIINSAISLYYYLRVIKTMFTPTDTVKAIRLTPLTGMVLIVITFSILLLGIFPSIVTGP